jgi:hypothetical protein
MTMLTRRINAALDALAVCRARFAGRGVYETLTADDG